MRRFTLITVMFALLFTGSTLHSQNRDWTILATYPIPESASGLAWDGSYLYCGIYGVNGERIYKINPVDGSYSLQCNGPQDDAYGLTYDGSNLWTIIQPSGSSNPALATEFTMSGSQLSQITLPDHYMSGIAYDDGDFWVSTYYDPDGYIYKINSSGSILESFAAPDEQPWDLCVDGDYLWMADYWGDALYKIEKSTGNLIESHPSENVDPAGIVFDGEFLWYCDAGGSGDNDVLYKVDLYGAGTPEINVPVTLHDYGIVTIGDFETWDCMVENTGDANLIITDIVIPDGVPVFTIFSTPQTLEPGDAVNIPFKYQPVEPGELNTSVTIESNDPITPEVNVNLLGEAVYDGPYASFETNSYDYGEVRMHAHTRWFLELENIGNDTLEISEIDYNSTNFYLDEGSQLPIRIAPLENIEIGTWFNPENGTDYTDTMKITHNGINEALYEVVLTGSGLKQEWPMGEVLWEYLIYETWDNSPKAITWIDDITHDEVEDVIVCSEDNGIRCFNGNSSGEADVMWHIEIYSGSVYQQAALQKIEDLNSDNFEDIIVGTAWGDRSVIALSGKTGEQIWKFETNTFGGGGWVYQVDVRYDYNGDGVKDPLAATGDDGGNTGPKRAFCLDGTTGDIIWDTPLNGAVFSIIGVEDFTGDGLPDAIAGSENTNEDEGKTSGLNGTNGNEEWTFTVEGSSVWALMQLNDITDDGIKDVAVGDFSGNYYYLDATDATIVQQQQIYGELLLRFEHMDDVNNDGYCDILVAHSGSDGMILNGYDASTIWFESIADKPWNVANIGDINDDGINDAIIGTLYNNNYGLFMSGTDGVLLESVSMPSATDAINSIPDIVGDGSMEMVAGGRDGNVICFSGGNLLNVSIPSNNVIHDAKPDIYPNPFRDLISIDFQLTSTQFVILNVYDINGNLISTPFSDEMPEGNCKLNWNGTDNNGKTVPRGIYFVEIIAGNKKYKERIIRL